MKKWDKLTIGGKEIEVWMVDANDGYYLGDLKDWNNEVAIELAKQDDLILSNEHWCLIREFRKYDQTYQCFPSMGVVNKSIAGACGLTYEKILLLFPKGSRQIGRIAGVSPPTCYGNEW